MNITEHHQRKIELRKLPPETNVYRFISFERLLTLLTSNQLYIPNTNAWEDSYENFLAKSFHTLQGHKIAYSQFIDCFFGLSFTLTPETDALWRIYSHDKKGVRIRTTLEKVMKSCNAEIDRHPYGTHIVISPVNYAAETDMYEWANLSCKSIFPNIDKLRESLFIKRLAFEHENEIRLLIQKQIPENQQQNYLSLPIDCNSFIDEITFDPRMTELDFQAVSTVVSQLGFSNTISKSSLYGSVSFNFEY